MTAEELFCDLYDKYGDFGWQMIPLTQSGGTLVEELKKEVGKEHLLYHKKLRAVAKCVTNNDVLYVTENGAGEDIYYIFCLTYSGENSKGVLKYREFTNIIAVKEFIERSYIQNKS